MDAGRRHRSATGRRLTNRRRRLPKVHGGWNILETLWLTGMLSLFAAALIEGNTVTRLYFMRLQRPT